MTYATREDAFILTIVPLQEFVPKYISALCEKAGQDVRLIRNKVGKIEKRRKRLFIISPKEPSYIGIIKIELNWFKHEVC